MKRALAILLAILMLVTMLVACQTHDTPDVDDPAKDPTDDPSTPSDDPSDDPTQGYQPTPEKQRDAYELVTAVGNENGPYLVKTVYATEQTIIADIIVTPEAYGVDPTGVKDSTEGIQKAVKDCRALGGGTVFLPAGQYLVTATIEIGEGVLLQGDWQDPDLTDSPEYGTVILAKTPTLSGQEVFDPSAKPLFRLIRENASNNGLSGLTIYYPEQDVKDVKPYGYTVYCIDPNMTVLRNLTLLNSYQGIGACLHGGGHELLHIDTVRMTALVKGYQAKKSSEIGYTHDLSISPKYWSEAAEQFRCTDAAALRDFCRENTVAMKFQSLDLNQYTGIRIESAYTAMLIDAGFWGIFYDVDIKDSVYGVVVQAMTGASGVGIAHATIEADVYAVANYSRGNQPLKLTDVKATGKGGIHTAEGAKTLIDDSEDLSKYDSSYDTYQKPADILYVADVADYEGKHEDAAPAIQLALDVAAKTGGIVYVPHGVYHLYSRLNVPTGVELRGAMAMPARDKPAMVGHIPGTVFLTYLEDGDFITLQESSGIQGLRIFYVRYDATTALEYIEADDPRVSSCVAIRGKGANVYAMNMVVTGSFVGIDFTDCDDHLVKNTFGLCFRHFIRAGGKNGSINAVLCNQTFTMRQPFYPRGMYDPDYYNDDNWKLLAKEGQDSYAVIRDLVVRKYCDTFYIKDAEGETLNNVFMYGPHTVLVADNADVVGINLTADWQGICPMFEIKNGSNVISFNPVRTSGTSHVCDDSSSLTLFNRLYNNFPLEPTYRSSTGYADTFGGEPFDTVTLMNCDSDKGAKNVYLNTDPTFIKQGKGSLINDGESPLTWLDATFDPADTAELGDGPLYLHMSVWIDNPHQMQWGGKITLGTAKGAYCTWGTVQSLENEGWNDILLAIPQKGDHPAFTSLKITVDHSTLKNYPVVVFDDIYVCNVLSYSDAKTEVGTELDAYVEKEAFFGAEPSRIMINDCETLEALKPSIQKIATLNTDPAFVKEGKASYKVDVSSSVFYEQLFPLTDARAFKNHGYLHMWVYIENHSAMVASGQIELTSGGTCDIGELGWDLRSWVTRSGWNELYLPLNNATSTGTPAFNPAGVNYLRLFFNAFEKTTVYIDDIYICNVRGGEYDESNTIAAGNAEALLKGMLPVLQSCDDDLGVDYATLNTDPAYIKEGKGSFKAATAGTVRMAYAMPFAQDITEYMDGYLHMWVYIDKVSMLGGGQIELTSGGTCDVQEIAWHVNQISRDGWNELYLPLNATFSTGGTFDPKNCNFIRIYNTWNAGDAVPVMYIDDIRLVKKEDAPADLGQSEPVKPGVDKSVLFDGETMPSGMKHVSQSKTEVKEGTYSLYGSTTAEWHIAYSFAARDISEYKDGYLHGWVYIDDISNIKTGAIELTSSGTWDKQEHSWTFTKYVTKSGWNEILLPMNDPDLVSELDFTRLNYLRIYTLYKETPTKPVVTYFDDFRFVKGENEGGATADGDLVLLDGERIPTGLRFKPALDTSKVKQGKSSIKTTTAEDVNMLLIHTFDPIDISGYKNGYLHFWMYVEDYDNIKGGQIELTSSGKWDKEETSWQVLNHVKHEGWNEVWLPLNAPEVDKDLDMTRLNFLRVFTLYHENPTQPVVTYFDDVRLTLTKGE